MGAQEPRSTDDWRPDQKAVLAWNALALLLFVLGLFVFGLPVVARAAHGAGTARTTVTISVASPFIVLAATAGLLVLHEAVHALVMRLFGARPRFGAIMVARLIPALYTTAPGHVFRRGQYVAVAVAPGLALSALGFLACFSPPGGYLVIPLAIHLAGCVGDVAATERVLRQPAGTGYEDLRDGIRFHRPSSSVPPVARR
jgi:hypothetical protein